MNKKLSHQSQACLFTRNTLNRRAIFGFFILSAIEIILPRDIRVLILKILFQIGDVALSTRRGWRKSNLDYCNSEHIIEIACGAYHSMVLTNIALYSCGSNSYGQLGLGDYASRSI